MRFKTETKASLVLKVKIMEHSRMFNKFQLNSSLAYGSPLCPLVNDRVNLSQDCFQYLKRFPGITLVEPNEKMERFLDKEHQVMKQFKDLDDEGGFVDLVTLSKDSCSDYVMKDLKFKIYRKKIGFLAIDFDTCPTKESLEELGGMLQTYKLEDAFAGVRYPVNVLDADFDILDYCHAHKWCVFALKSFVYNEDSKLPITLKSVGIEAELDESFNKVLNAQINRVLSYEVDYRGRFADAIKNKLLPDIPCIPDLILDNLDRTKELTQWKTFFNDVLYPIICKIRSDVLSTSFAKTEPLCFAFVQDYAQVVDQLFHSFESVAREKSRYLNLEIEQQLNIMLSGQLGKLGTIEEKCMALLLSCGYDCIVTSEFGSISKDSKLLHVSSEIDKLKAREACKSLVLPSYYDPNNTEE